MPVWALSIWAVHLHKQEAVEHVSVVIETHDLTKVYEGALKGQDVLALKSLNLNVNEGEILAYLGPNGSGKTTTIKLLLGLIFPTSGTLKILGSANTGSNQVKQNIGYLPEGAYYPEFLRGEEVLRFYGQLYGMGGKFLEKRISEVIEIVGMTHARRRLIRGYSKGMRQRIGLAQALISNPKLLILDEPTTGLDPIARKEIRDILVRLRDEGKTLLISSHELLEVELISNRVAILFEGALKAQGAIDELLTERETTLQVQNVNAAAMEKLTNAGITTEDNIENISILRVPTHVSLYDALDICKEQHVTLVGIRPRRETLEELFVRVVGDAVKERALAV